MFKILVCKSCGERYDASGMDGIKQFNCAGCGRNIEPSAKPFPDWFTQVSRCSTRLSLRRNRRPKVGQRIGPYKVLAEVARGGMGVVYRCAHVNGDRPVALKVLNSPRRSGRNMVQRFRHEARTVLAMDHPNIIPVYDIGHSDGLHYFSMKYVEGCTLDTHLSRSRLKQEKAVRWLVEVADALDHLHGRGVVHRDVKPGNIMINDSGTAFLIDFGLAKNIGSPHHLTRPGMAMGTPAYMSPEQADGERNIDGRADIYSLGAVLFEIITGQPPFRGESLMETMLMVVSNRMPSVREHCPDVDPRLEAICLKALQKDRSRRYQSAGAMREDLERYLAGRPVKARPQSLREKMVDNIHRYKTPGILFMASMAGGVAVLTCLLALSGRL